MKHVIIGIDAKPHTCGRCFRWEFNRPESKPNCSLFKKPLFESGERSDCGGTYLGDMSYEFYRCLECLQAEAEITVKVQS